MTCTDDAAAPTEHFPLQNRLHTDVLADKYGPMHVEVVKHDTNFRVAHLVDAGGVSRTFALTFLTFDVEKDRELSRIDREVANGGLIGKSFRDHAYEVRKNVIAVYVLPRLPESIRRRFGVQEWAAKTRLSEFYAGKPGVAPEIYGIVTEIYSPDFRPAVVNATDLTQVNPTTNALKLFGFREEEIWERIGSGNDWSDVRDRYEQAAAHSRAQTDYLLGQVGRYMAGNEV